MRFLKFAYKLSIYKMSNIPPKLQKFCAFFCIYFCHFYFFKILLCISNKQWNFCKEKKMLSQSSKTIPEHWIFGRIPLCYDALVILHFIKRKLWRIKCIFDAILDLKCGNWVSFQCVNRAHFVLSLCVNSNDCLDFFHWKLNWVHLKMNMHYVAVKLSI